MEYDEKVKSLGLGQGSLLIPISFDLFVTYLIDCYPEDKLLAEYVLVLFQRLYFGYIRPFHKLVKYRSLICAVRILEENA